MNTERVLCLQQSWDTSIPLNQGISTPRLKRLQRGKLKCEKRERRRSKGPTNIGQSLPPLKWVKWSDIVRSGFFPKTNLIQLFYYD